jgi:hypothetical protein
MNLELYQQIGNERIEALRHEANIITQLKALFAPRPMKKIKTLRQFEQRRVAH